MGTGSGAAEKNKKEVSIYTDGACSGNPGPGGWAAILVFGNHERELSGGEKCTTNNRMELTAVLSALEALKEPCRVELYSDSKYIVDAVEKGWVVAWQARGWKKADKENVKNTDLWERLLSLLKVHEVSFTWVKGHAENEFNRRCDSLAVTERKKFFNF
jgi:ribonuclease HI